MQILLQTNEPTVELIAYTQLDRAAVERMAQHIQARHPECFDDPSFAALFPHEDRVDDGALLAEIAGRACYASFGKKAGRKSNAEYIAHTQAGEHKHASILYHPKLTFYIAGVSRRMTHELIRHYVGADRTEEGSPSMESTRFTEHPGRFVVPPKILGDAEELKAFGAAMLNAYASYLSFIRGMVSAYETREGHAPKGLDRKRIYEAAAAMLPGAADTALIWTTNPIALKKLVDERSDEAADLEFQRLARLMKKVAFEHSPNLFPAWK